MILKCKRNVYRQFRKSLSDLRLEYFKREIKSVLKKQLNSLKDDVEKSFYIVDSLKKSMLNPLYESEIMEKAHREHLVPKQIRALNKKTGKTYTTTVYINPNKQYGLNKYHETDSKGAKIAIAKLIKAVDRCQSEEELYKLVLRNKGRFSDNEGKPLPIVTELRKYVDKKQNNIGKTQSKKQFREPVKDWIVKLAAETGLNIKGFKHKTTEDFERHVIKKHGNEKIENARGQIAVTEQDLKNIDDVMNNPDIAVAGVKKNGKDRIILVKNNEHGSVLVEEVLSGNKNKSLNAKTFWIMDKNIDEEKIKKILANTNGYDISKIKTATPTAANSVLLSSQTDDGGRNSAGKGNGSKPATSGEVKDNSNHETLAIDKPRRQTGSTDNIPQSDNSVKENNNDVNNESEKRAAELKKHIESVFDKYINDSYTRNTAETIVKKYGKKKLEDIANNKIKDDEEYKKFLTERVASVEKEEGKQLDDDTIDMAIWKHCLNVYIQKLAREKLKSMEANEKMVDLPVSDSDMNEAIGIIGSDVTRILNGRDTYGNAKQGLVDKIKRRVRNSPGVARAMLVYIKQEQEKTGKKVFTEKHSIWDYLPKLNEQAREAAEKGESETKTGVSGALYTGDDGTTVVENKDWGRYQISFPGKPDYETISTLKHNGFRWSPKTQTWVCYNTANGEYSLKRVAEKLGLKKNDVQKSIFLKVDEMRKSLFMEKGLWDRA